MPSQAGTVFVVDDDPSVCASVKRLLRTAGHRVRTFSSTAKLPRTGRLAEPCCLVLDVEMPQESGLQFKAALDQLGIRIPTIFMTGVGDIPMGVGAIKGGAIDFLTKPFDVDQLLDAVDKALAADARLLDAERRLNGLRRRFELLTAREQEVFFAVTSGLLNKQAAAKLNVSEKTIKAHRGRVTEKMGAESIAELVRMADALRATAAGTAAEPAEGAAQAV